MSHQNKASAMHLTEREKRISSKSKTAHPEGKGVLLIVVYWAIGLGIVSYIISRFVVAIHPIHWASLAGGVLLGIVIGYVWYFTRGDVGLI